jgi:hypothetical protein
LKADLLELAPWQSLGRLPGVLEDYGIVGNVNAVEVLREERTLASSPDPRD